MDSAGFFWVQTLAVFFDPKREDGLGLIPAVFFCQGTAVNGRNRQFFEIRIRSQAKPDGMLKLREEFLHLGIGDVSKGPELSQGRFPTEKEAGIDSAS